MDSYECLKQDPPKKMMKSRTSAINIGVLMSIHAEINKTSVAKGSLYMLTAHRYVRVCVCKVFKNFKPLPQEAGGRQNTVKPPFIIGHI